MSLRLVPEPAVVVADEAVVREWLTALLGAAGGRPVQVCSTGDLTGRASAELDQLVAYVLERDAAGAPGIFFRATPLVGPLAAGKRGGDDDAAALTMLHLDLDVAGPGHKPAKLPLPPDRAAVLSLIAHLPEPTIRLDSGGGLWPLWVLDTPWLLADATDRGQAGQLLSKWYTGVIARGELAGWHVDNTCDLARVVRVPGTVNRKLGCEPALVQIVAGPGRHCGLSELLAAAAAGAPAPMPSSSSTSSTSSSDGLGHLEGEGVGTILSAAIVAGEQSWADLVAPFGWKWVRNGRANGRPVEVLLRSGDPTSKDSAKGFVEPAVLMVHSAAAGLPVGKGQALTPLRVLAGLMDLPMRPLTDVSKVVIAHAAGELDDRLAGLSAVVLERIRAWAPGGSPADTARFVDPVRLEAFWAARPVLQHLHDFALSRRVSPWGMLGPAMARVVAATEPDLVLPKIVGDVASLNLFIGLVGRSGAGKGTADSAAKAGIAGLPRIAQSGVGSGEGILHCFTHWQAKPAPGHQVIDETRVLLTAAEVDTLAALAARQSSTLMAELRKLWMGEELSFAYVDRAKKLNLPEHTYRACLIIGVQPRRAGALLDEVNAAGGTPQRIVWLPAENPDAPDNRPVAPEPWPWSDPMWMPSSVLGDLAGRRVLRVCATADREVDAAHLIRHKGHGGDELDAHLMLCRLKVAAALMLLDGRADEVTEQDWALAGVVMDVSNATRAGVVAELDRVGRESNTSKALA